LHIREGSKVWVLRYRITGREKTITLGHYPSLGLADARLAAADKRSLLAQGIDPVAVPQLPFTTPSTTCASADQGNGSAGDLCHKILMMLCLILCVV
jgi:hypothetical protein